MFSPPGFSVCPFPACMWPYKDGESHRPGPLPPPSSSSSLLASENCTQGNFNSAPSSFSHFFSLPTPLYIFLTIISICFFDLTLVFLFFFFSLLNESRAALAFLPLSPSPRPVLVVRYSRGEGQETFVQAWIQDTFRKCWIVALSYFEWERKRSVAFWTQRTAL